MDVYVVERFLVDWSDAEVDDLIDRCAAAHEAFARRGVRLVQSILLPADETCLSVFTGPDAATVLEVDAEAGLPAGRLVAGVTHCSGVRS
jgi:hypothetical protein